VPTVLRSDGYRFFFYANEGNEPAHIHVQKAEAIAKFWLVPETQLEFSEGFNSAELRRIYDLIEENRPTLLERWNGFFMQSP
jgi:hypothetical protein